MHDLDPTYLYLEASYCYDIRPLEQLLASPQLSFPYLGLAQADIQEGLSLEMQTPSHTAPGTDGWRKHELAALPQEIRRALVDLMRQRYVR